ncbi:uncharacterized protein DFL_002830 [Arthrobotrys flagrans]|uniref:Uncharacterized protein n=1 Tax=Arthrobotrys flagrans TaxID=97331 RepID=A0A437ABM5_ARTFL|nr:hypothetical protein DFL_002830 [Arthrobotrys flagrans]
MQLTNILVFLTAALSVAALPYPEEGDKTVSRPPRPTGTGVHGPWKGKWKSGERPTGTWKRPRRRPKRSQLKKPPMTKLSIVPMIFTILTTLNSRFNDK